MFDEPCRSRPDYYGVLVKLIDELNPSTGCDLCRGFHDVPEVLSIADNAYIVAQQHVIAQGTGEELRENQDPRVRQFRWYCGWACSIPFSRQ